MTWTGRPTLESGAYPRASEMEAILDQVDSLTAPGWTTYTPAWTTSGTAPAVGNGTFTGRYRQAAGSDLIIAEQKLTYGSTTSSGTGVFFFSLPTSASSSSLALAGGTWHALDSGVQEYGGITKLESATTFRMIIAAAGGITNGGPFTFGSGDAIRAQVFYEPA